MIRHDVSHLFGARRAGVLLHPTSLPATWGVLGASARRFIDFLGNSGIRVWQMLPLGPPHPDRSPYQTLSAHAGNPDLIDLAELTGLGLLALDELSASPRPSRRDLLDLAAQRFLRQGGCDANGLDLEAYSAFRRANQYWLDDFCLFCAARERLGASSWLAWPADLKDRQPAAMRAFIHQETRCLDRLGFEQFLFQHQWRMLREYAHRRDIRLFGDIPIFVAHDSADVWANRTLFKLDADGGAAMVAGVPPDYFSAEGQHWGNPVYDWGAMAQSEYRWWLDRLDSQRHLFDLMRIDHFRGLQAYWEIPADAPQPCNGHWADGPGKSFLEACFRRFPQLPLVAENLGHITDDVERLRRQFGLPGMTVMQFGFDGSPDNPHLLHNHQPQDLVYTGTHDNDTTLGWYKSLDQRTQDYVNHYLGISSQDMPWAFVEAALSSACSMAVIPLQDFMALGSDARFNTPGTTTGNWIWQLDWAHCSPVLAEKMADAVRRHRRDL